MSDSKLIAFDVDGTLTNENIWQAIFNAVGITKEADNTLFAPYYRKEISFEQVMETILSTYFRKKQTKEVLLEIIRSIPLRDDATQVIHYLQSKYDVCLVSCGIDLYVSYIAKILGVSEWFANYAFTFDEHERIYGLTYSYPEYDAKTTVLQTLVRTRKLRPDQIVYVGDSINDMGAFTFTQHGVLIGKGVEETRQASWKQISRLSELLEFL